MRTNVDWKQVRALSDLEGTGAKAVIILQADKAVQSCKSGVHSQPFSSESTVLTFVLDLIAIEYPRTRHC